MQYRVFFSPNFVAWSNSCHHSLLLWVTILLIVFLLNLARTLQYTIHLACANSVTCMLIVCVIVS